MTKILVTGGAGFIGSHLVERLLRDESNEVIVFDDLSTGVLGNLPFNKRLEFRQGNTADSGDGVSAAIGECEIVYHLASPVGVKRVVRSPYSMLAAMLEGCQRVVDSCIGGTPLVLASSSEVYGEQSVFPITEDAPTIPGSPQSVRWHYALGKLANEHQAMAAHQEHGLPVTILRLFNVAGPRQTGRYGMVIPRFVKAALNDEPLLVFGSGKQTRCFAHVSDVVETIVELTESDKGWGQIFNIGDDREISIEGLAQSVVYWLGSNSAITRVPYTDKRAYGADFGDTMRRVPGLDLIQQFTDHKPAFGVEEIIRDVAKQMGDTVLISPCS